MKHLLLLFAFTISLMVRGQVTPIPYLEPFNGTTIPADWSQIDHQGDGFYWEFGTDVSTGIPWDPTSPLLSGNYAILNSDKTPGVDIQNVDLISPTFDFTGVSLVNLQFKHYYLQWGTSTASLSYSIDDGTNWTEIKQWDATTSNPETFNQIIVAVAGQSQVKFKWNYIGTDAWGWAVDDVSVSETTVAIWTGAVNTNWDEPGNWVSSVVPGAGSNVTIPSTANKPVIQTDAVCLDLTIGLGATVTINPQKSLTVYNVLTNNTANGLVLESDGSGTGSLIAASAAGAGTSEIQRYMTGNQWHYVSSPVDQTIASFLSNNSNIPTKGASRGMMDFDTGSDVWNGYFTDATIGNFETSKGYSVRNDADGNVTFNGAIHTGIQVIPLSPSGNGWNLIGNPFTSAIKINNASGVNNFLAYNGSSIDANYFGIYVWNGTDYDIINHVSGPEYATLGQGFFVKNTIGTTADFTAEMQVHKPSVSLKSGIVIPEIKLFVSTAKKSVSTDIKFLKDATAGLDKGFDAGILKADPSFSVFTHLVNDNNVEFALQCLPLTNIGTMTVPVGIDFSEGGEVTISAQLLNLPSESRIVFEDRLLNVFTTLNSEKSAYSTTLAANSKGIGRFFLHVFSAQTTDINNKSLDNKINAWMDRNDIVIQGVTETNAIAALYDVRGSLILKKNLENITTNRVNVIGINSGIYMLQVVENGKRTGIKLQISGN